MTWASVPLKRLAVDMQPGFACQPTTADNGVPQLRTNNVSAEGRLDLSELKHVPASPAEIEKYSLMPGDILFNNTNSPALVGKTAFFRESGQFLFSNHMTRIRVDRALAEPRYVARFLHWAWSQGAFRALVTQWVNQAAINRTQLGSVPLPLPAPSEQRRIVEILDQADNLRRLRADADAKAERILSVLFIKMFGDPATNPKGWPTEPLGDVGELDRGRSRHRPRNAPALLGGPYPLIQTGDVANSDGRIRHHTQTYSEVGLAQSKMWPAGTLCITIAANIAKTGVLEFDACFPDSIVGFNPGPRITTEYVQFLLGHLQAVLEGSAPQVAQKNINLEVLKNIPTAIPPIVLQRQFSDNVARHYQSRLRQLKVREKLERLFSSTLTRAFSGDLTASWREGHMRELLEEMEQQARTLREIH